jgi:hypothetical protein
LVVVAPAVMPIVCDSLRRHGAQHTIASFKNFHTHRLIKLAHYNSERKLCLYADASISGWAYVLTQVPVSEMRLPHAERDHQPLDFLSGCFRGASCNWSVIEKEAFALIRALTATDYFCQAEAVVVIYTRGGEKFAQFEFEFVFANIRQI